MYMKKPYVILPSTELRKSVRRASTNLPISNQSAVPTLGNIRVAAHVGCAIRVPAMRPLQLHSLGALVIDPFRAHQSRRGNPLFHPVHNVPKHVCAGISRVDVLAKCPGSVAAAAVSHATDTEEAEEVVEVHVRCVHGRGYVAVVAHCLFAGDDGVGAAVVGNELSTCGLESTEVARVGRDVAVFGVDAIGVGNVEGVECCWVPG